MKQIKLFGMVVLAISIILAFGFTACDNGNGGNPDPGGDDPVIITLVRNTGHDDLTGDSWDNWYNSYAIPSSVTGGKINKYDVYTFTYSFTSNINITAGSLKIALLDDSGNRWKDLSYWDPTFGTGIQANTTVSGTRHLLANDSADAASKLTFMVDPASGAASAPTLTFTKFSLVKTANASDIQTMTLARNTGDNYDNWQMMYNIPSSVTGSKITEGDIYTLTYSFKSNVAISGDVDIFLVDNSDTWELLSDRQKISNITANTTRSGTITLTATGTASSTAAGASRICFVIEPVTGAASEPILTFTTFSLVKGGGGTGGTYIITGSGSSFTATKSGATVGTANQPLQTVGNAVRADANGANCTIQFGNGTSVLDIGTETVQFNNTGGTWGVISITGKITSSATNTIWLVDGVSMNSTADIANTTNRAIYNDGAGTVTITSGTINGGISNGGGGTTAGIWGTLIVNGGTINGRISNGGALTVNNGTIVSTSGVTVSNTSISGLGNIYTVTINGGTIESRGTTSSDYAISNTGPNTVTISGNSTIVKSAYYTVCNIDNGIINISGGTIESTGTNGRAIYTYKSHNNAEVGTLNITGGTVKATGTGGYAIYNNSGGTVTIGAGATITGNTSGVN